MATAMRAIYGAYDAKRGATLLPPGPRDESRRVLATPLLAATYLEGGVRKAVLAVQLQWLDEYGSIIGGHPSPTAVSVYVFREQDGAFVFEKGAREAGWGGAYASAPAGRLVRLGPDRYGLWFEWGDSNQGYTNDDAFIVSLSEPRVSTVFFVETGRSNRGACGRRSDGSVERCWGFTAYPELVPLEGEPYDLLRIRHVGTEQREPEQPIRRRAESVCHAHRGGKYRRVERADCADLPARPAEESFDVGAILGRPTRTEIAPHRASLTAPGR